MLNCTPQIGISISKTWPKTTKKLNIFEVTFLFYYVIHYPHFWWAGVQIVYLTFSLSISLYGPSHDFEVISSLFGISFVTFTFDNCPLGTRTLILRSQFPEDQYAQQSNFTGCTTTQNIRINV